MPARRGPGSLTCPGLELQGAQGLAQGGLTPTQGEARPRPWHGVQAAPAQLAGSARRWDSAASSCLCRAEVGGCRPQAPLDLEGGLPPEPGTHTCACAHTYTHAHTHVHTHAHKHMHTHTRRQQGPGLRQGLLPQARQPGPLDRGRARGRGPLAQVPPGGLEESGTHGRPPASPCPCVPASPRPRVPASPRPALTPGSSPRAGRAQCGSTGSSTPRRLSSRDAPSGLSPSSPRACLLPPREAHDGPGPAVPGEGGLRPGSGLLTGTWHPGGPGLQRPGNESKTRSPSPPTPGSPASPGLSSPVGCAPAGRRPAQLPFPLRTPSARPWWPRGSPALCSVEDTLPPAQL